MSKDSFVFYTKYKDALLMLSDTERSEILMACIEYVSEGDLPEFRNPAAGMLFKIIRSDIDADKKKYEERCERNRENIQKRWNTNVYDRIRPNTNDTNDTDRIGMDRIGKDRIGEDRIGMDSTSTARSHPYMEDKAEQKRQISDITKITLSRMGGAS